MLNRTWSNSEPYWLSFFFRNCNGTECVNQQNVAVVWPFFFKTKKKRKKKTVVIFEPLDPRNLMTWGKWCICDQYARCPMYATVASTSRTKKEKDIHGWLGPFYWLGVLGLINMDDAEIHWSSVAWSGIVQPFIHAVAFKVHQRDITCVCSPR